jgi:hypothetical protein
MIMLLPLMIAVAIVLAIGFTLYAFRVSIAKCIGLVHRKMQEDKLEIRREYKNGLRDK